MVSSADSACDLQAFAFVFICHLHRRRMHVMLMMVTTENTVALESMGFPPTLAGSWMRRMTVGMTPLI